MSIQDPKIDLLNDITPDWIHETRTIREWVNGGGVMTPRLVAELDQWANYFRGEI